MDGVLLVRDQYVHGKQVVRQQHDLALYLIAVGILVILDNKDTAVCAVGVTPWRLRAQHLSHFIGHRRPSNLHLLGLVGQRYIPTKG